MIRKDLINEILREFAIILQSYKPNLEELELIQLKISQMVERNRRMVLAHRKIPRKERKTEKPEKWYRIEIED